MKRELPESQHLRWLAQHFGGSNVDDVRMEIEELEQARTKLVERANVLRAEIAERQQALEVVEAAIGPIDPPPRVKTDGHKCQKCGERYVGRKCPCKSNPDAAKQTEPTPPATGEPESEE